jgi:hypothetical protein
MKKISKFLSVVLALVLTFAIIPVASITAGAATTIPEIKLIPSKAAAQIGELITIYVTVPKNSRLCNLDLDVVYNKANYQLVEAKSKYEFDIDVLNTDGISNAVRFVGNDTTYISDNATVLFTMKFRVINNCRDIYAIVHEAHVADAKGKPIDVSVDANLLSTPITIHQSGDEKVYYLPTCEETGFKTYNCPCGTFVEEDTPAYGHKYSNGKCVVCKANAPKENITVMINEPSRTEIRSKDGIILHAEVRGGTGEYVVEWSASDSKCFKTEKNGNDLKIISNNKGYTTFTAAVYGADGKVVSSASIEMYSKAGFFDKIGGFFRSLFGSTVVYDY